VCVCGVCLAQNGTVVSAIVMFGVEAAAVLLIASQGGGFCLLESYSFRVRGDRFFFLLNPPARGSLSFAMSA
jgi:hypothetical protein